jgi:hypothetical protein
MADHCWHVDGLSISLGMQGGCDQALCCRCGAKGEQSWIIQQVPLPGHGPHFRLGQRVAQATRVIAGESTCAGAPATEGEDGC